MRSAREVQRESRSILTLLRNSCIVPRLSARLLRCVSSHSAEDMVDLDHQDRGHQLAYSGLNPD